MTGRFDLTETRLPGLLLLQRKPMGDERGYFERLFCSAELEVILHGSTVAQINRSFTRQAGTVRGMHFQHPPYAEIKLVTCLRGEVFDVAVDLRQGSPTFLRWHAERLNGDNHRTLAIPRGFAHGFQTLTENCEMLYLHTSAYQPTADAGLHPCDPTLAISWPMPVAQLSQRDASHPFIDESFLGVAQ